MLVTRQGNSSRMKGRRSTKLMDGIKHIIAKIKEGSIAQEMEIVPGDILISINGEMIEDIFDYQYIIQDSYLEILIEKADGEEWLLEIDKEYDEDLGIEFENGLMDEYKSCHNKCIFCFIDQMPKGMRETLYFKDDDSRLSFLQGNYVTLTNMSQKDIDRIIKYHMSPINISFQTTNPKLRCEMLNNRFAGDALNKVIPLFEAGIEMNGQIVLCKGVNDSEELERSIKDLSSYLPHLKSVSVVPVGLSKFREGLYPLEPFHKEDAIKVLDLIHKWQEELFPKYGLHFIHASDEWYLLAERELPVEENYDGYLQLENGVGMLRLLMDEFEEALEEVKKTESFTSHTKRVISLATGALAYSTIEALSKKIMDFVPELTVNVYKITNNFFGEHITVSGLITGIDLMQQLKEKELGEKLLLPQNMLRSQETVFLDDVTVADLEKTLQVKIDIVKSSGREFVKSMIEK